MIRRTSPVIASALAGVLLVAALLLTIHSTSAREPAARMPAAWRPAAEPATQADRPQGPSAPPPQPFEPYGYVRDNGANVAPGTEIAAICPDLVVTPTTTVFPVGSEMGYFLTMPGDDPATPEKEGCSVGEVIQFEIDGQLAYQTANWVLGDNPQIDLTTSAPAPAVELKLLTAGQAAPMPPGPYVEAGKPVTWTYIISSTGDVSLNRISVSDDRGTPGVPGDDELVCGIAHLVLGEPQFCTFSTTATLGLQANSAAVAGDFNGQVVSDTAMGHYQGVIPDLALSLRVNEETADEPPGPTILAGETVTWRYLVTNTGGITLSLVTLTHDGGPTECQLQDLGPNQSDSCSVAGIAVAGQQVTNGQAVGTPLFGMTLVSDTNPGHYFGAAPGLRLEKSTNGEDADQPPGPRIALEQAITWRYMVTNTGNITLTNVVIRDDNGTPDTGDDFDVCTVVELPAGGSDSCIKNDGLVILGQYSNVGLATTLYASKVVSDTDSSHYFGVEQLKWWVYLPAIKR